MGVVATRFVRCEPPYRHTMGHHFIRVLFNDGVISKRRMPLLSDVRDNLGYDEGRSMRFPFRD
jgi:hypothetical protein